MPGPRIAALFVYPLKGGRGIALDSARIAVTGVAAGGVADRQWMVVDAQGRFISQREIPELALVGMDAGWRNGDIDPGHRRMFTDGKFTQMAQLFDHKDRRTRFFI